MTDSLTHQLAIALTSLAFATAVAAQQSTEPDHIRGQITKMDDTGIVVKNSNGTAIPLDFSDNMTVIVLSKASFTSVEFGTYVGAVAIKLDEFSPIIRDSAVWLHKSFELRVIDEELRGIALGEKNWDLTSASIISHGWVDDMEDRILSIKWGPSDYDETDVEVPRDVPVLRMSLANKSLLKTGGHILAGAQKNSNGRYVIAFIFIGKDGIVPPL